MAWINETILKLQKQLLPRGRAFKVQPGGVFEKLLIALNISGGKAYDDAVSILDSIIPDNANFTTDDATQWERRLAIISNPATSLILRKLAILQKMAYPGNMLLRATASYLEAQLQLAGFNVFIYENRFFVGGQWVSVPPSFIIPGLGTAAYGAFGYGELGYGDDITSAGAAIVANYIEEAKDNIFAVGANYNCTFFIAGATISTFATVPISRKNEFRQLIIQLKQLQAIGIALINYV